MQQENDRLNLKLKHLVKNTFPSFLVTAMWLPDTIIQSIAATSSSSLLKISFPRMVRLIDQAPVRLSYAEALAMTSWWKLVTVAWLLVIHTLGIWADPLKRFCRVTPSESSMSKLIFDENGYILIYFKKDKNKKKTVELLLFENHLTDKPLYNRHLTDIAITLPFIQELFGWQVYLNIVSDKCLLAKGMEPTNAHCCPFLPKWASLARLNLFIHLSYWYKDVLKVHFL